MSLRATFFPLTACEDSVSLLRVRSGRPSGSPDLAFLLPPATLVSPTFEQQENEMGFLKKLFGGMPGTDDHGVEPTAPADAHDHDHEHDHDHGDGAHSHDEPVPEDSTA
jgi:hypothetical protein